MKRHPSAVWIVVLSLGLFSSYFNPDSRALAQGKAGDSKITVLTPLGTPPSIKLRPMAPRLTTLEGKTIYLVNQGYLGTDNLLNEMKIWLEREYPKTKFVYAALGREMGPQPPSLFAEIKEKGDGMIMGLGH
jgi:hypothetical protein